MPPLTMKLSRWDPIVSILGGIGSLVFLAYSFGILFAIASGGRPTPARIAIPVVLAFGVLALYAQMIRKMGMTRPRVVVGRDGFVVRRPGKAHQFISYARVADVRASPRGLIVVFQDRKFVELNVMSHVFKTNAQRGRCSALHARLLAEIEAWRAAPDLPANADLLQREGRSVEAWRTGLATAVTDGSTGYRDRRLSRPEAQQVLEDRSAALELRIGAALALSSGPPEERSRLRIAVDGYTNERVRVALDKALSGELDARTLHQALEAEEDAEIGGARVSPRA